MRPAFLCPSFAPGDNTGYDKTLDYRVVDGMGCHSTTKIRRALPPARAGLQLVALLVALWIPLQASADLVYKYVDRFGNVTYTDRTTGPGYEILDFTTKGWVDRAPSKINLNYSKKNRELYQPMVASMSEQFGLSPELVHAVITVESAYDHRAMSPAGAMGLMQLMPGTAKRYGVRDAFNANENLRGGTRYLKDLMKMFGGDIKLVLAAYNAGEGAVQKYGNAIPPYRETQNYVRKVLEHYNLLLQQQISMR